MMKHIKNWTHNCNHISKYNYIKLYINYSEYDSEYMHKLSKLYKERITCDGCNTMKCRDCVDYYIMKCKYCERNICKLCEYQYDPIDCCMECYCGYRRICWTCLSRFESYDEPATFYLQYRAETFKCSVCTNANNNIYLELLPRDIKRLILKMAQCKNDYNIIDINE